MTETVAHSHDSVARVALDLAVRIAHDERDKTRNREYWLSLVKECRQALESERAGKAGSW